MDVVVYIKGGENESLKYAIRSWCQNLTFDKLCVVGGPKPKWLNPDIYIERPLTQTKMLQCYENVRAAMLDDRLSENVLLLMDDVFVLHPSGIWKTNYNRGTMISQYERGVQKFGPNPYDDQVLYTNNALSTTKAHPISFEEHAPFNCNRHLMSKVLDIMSNDKIDCLLYRSIYGNTFNCKTKFKLDVKMQNGNESIEPSDIVISTSAIAFAGAVGEEIKRRFPTMSRYETY